MAKKDDSYKVSFKTVSLIFVGAAVVSVALGQMANDAAVAAIGIGFTTLLIGFMYHAAENR